MRNYRDIGKTGVSFLTAFASGTSLDQDATGEGLLLHPGLYTNSLLPHNSLENVNEKMSTPQFIINPIITPNLIANDLIYTSNSFTFDRLPSNQNVLTNEHLGNTILSHFKTENYPTNHHILVNQHLGNTKYTYEVKQYENS